MPEGDPDWKNIYWHALIVFDFLTTFLLLTYLNPGLVLSNLIIISDVLINTNLFTFFGHYKIIFQVAFSLLIFCTTPIIWKKVNLKRNTNKKMPAK